MSKDEILEVMVGAGLSEDNCAALEKIGYFDAPASLRHHLAQPGGLADHSINVGLTLYRLSESLGIEWERQTGPMIVGLLHDLVKCSCYRAKSNQTDADRAKGFEWTPGFGSSHGFYSEELAAANRIDLCEDERMAIMFHMGRFGIGKEYLEDEYAHALSTFPMQVLATHFADWWSSSVIEREGRER